MLNKPSGYVTARKDDLYPTVMELIPEEYGDLHPIGRLDIDTHGLLLFTDDGAATIALTAPEAHMPKEYTFYAFGEIDDAKAEALRNGVKFGKYMSRPARFEVTDTFTVAHMQDIMPPDKREHYMKNPTGSAFRGILTISEGRKHQVKLMLRAVGCRILLLQRTAIGDISLGDLAEGEYRALTDDEIILIEHQKQIYSDYRS